MATKTSSRKKSAARRYAPIGVWVAGFALLVGLVWLAIKLIVFMGIYTPTTNASKAINAIGLGALAGFVIGLAVFALLDPKRVRKLLAGRQARHGSSALITLIAVIGIIFVVNLFAYQNPLNWEKWDWTQDKSHTLAPETLDALASLPAPVEAIGFYSANNYSRSSAVDLLTDFKDSSEGKFDYRVVDPESSPTIAQQYNITRDGTIVLVMGDQQELISYASEQNVTNALIRLISPELRVVYFMTGHGEYDSQNSGDASYTRVRSLLEARNYAVRTLNLRAENKIPADALAIIIPGRTEPFTDGEVDLLKAFVEQGGSLVIMEDPTVFTKMGSEPDPLGAYLSESWGIHFNNDIVIDPSSNPLTFAISYSYGSHAITQKIQTTTITFFPVARSIVAGAVADVQPTALVLTIDSAWGETNFNSLSDATFAYQANEDTPGPITLASAFENTVTQARIVVYGNAAFASDPYVDQYGNADLVISSIEWAVNQDTITLPPKTTTTRTLLPISTFAWLMLGLIFILIIPGLIVAGGVISWLVRRAKG